MNFNGLMLQIQDYINNDIHPFENEIQLILPILINIRNSARAQELYFLEQETQRYINYILPYLNRNDMVLNRNDLPIAPINANLNNNANVNNDANINIPPNFGNFNYDFAYPN